MKTLLLILVCSLSFSGHCQTNALKLALTKDSDTVFWKQVVDNDITEFNLPVLKTEPEFVFRSWNPGSFIEISKDKHRIKGKITYYVFEVWEGNDKADTFVKEYILPDSTSSKLYKFISNSGIKKIPSDKFINGWHQGLDGITYIYELKENNSYSFKHYWTPETQDQIKEAAFIIEFNKKINEIGNLKQYGEDFIKQISFLSYKYSGQAYTITKIMTSKEWRKYKRKRKKQMRKKKKN